MSRVNGFVVILVDSRREKIRLSFAVEGLTPVTGLFEGEMGDTTHGRVHSPRGIIKSSSSHTHTFHPGTIDDRTF
jgi:hypothetical protein